MKSSYENLPKEIQKKVVEVLSAFNRCEVVFEYGQWSVEPGCCMKSKYAPDYKSFELTFEQLKNIEEVKQAREYYNEIIKKL